MAFARGSWMRVASVGVLTLALVGVAGCGTGGSRNVDDGRGWSPFGRDSAPKGGEAAQIGVNAYLWRAALDTLSFMPLASADPYGGVVITDWYANPEKPDERFKATVYILDTRLRADGLNVTVFKQVADGAGGWMDAPTAAQTETDIENAILTKARQLRLANMAG